MTDTDTRRNLTLGSALIILGPAGLWLLALAVTLVFGNSGGCAPTESATDACFILGADIRPALIYSALFTAFAWILILPWTLATSIIWLFRRYRQSRRDTDIGQGMTS